MGVLKRGQAEPALSCDKTRINPGFVKKSCFRTFSVSLKKTNGTNGFGIKSKTCKSAFRIPVGLELVEIRPAEVLKNKNNIVKNDVFSR